MSHPLHVAFIWHMHQPYYRDLVTKACSMPWARLHAAKDYLDMVKRLEAFPAIHQTFNIVPSLVDQWEEYLPPQNASDEFLELSRKPAAQLSDQDKRFLLQWFFLANIERMIKPYPRYHDLLAKRGLQVREERWPDIVARFKTQDLLDLQVWFNLAWIDPWLRASDPALAALEQRGSRFTEEEKAIVLNAHAACLGQLIPTYRAAADRGQIELACSPYYHPILPLLCDVRVAHAALPHLPLPEGAFRHPEEGRWQIQEGLTRHEAAFGRRAAGMWPPEGSVSEEAARLVMEAGVQWIATDEEILWRTLKTARSPTALYRPHLLRRKEGRLAILFRDRELSDLIGFVYSQWDPAIAVADFLKRLGDLHAQFCQAPQPALVSIILDGENAWEFYPKDGDGFLTKLYQALARDERFRCVTVSEFLSQHPLDHAESLPELFPGSWIDANFATWVGHPEKNTAWLRLRATWEALASVRLDPATRTRAHQSLAAAAGSDWMWWFGDTHYSAQAEEFDRLFRTHLANAYRVAGLEVPPTLQQPIRQKPIALRDEPTGPVHPTIDGRETSYYEWLYAGRADLTQQYSAIQRAEQRLRRLYYGSDQTHYQIRLDMDLPLLKRLPAWTLELSLSHGVQLQIVPGPGGSAQLAAAPPHAAVSCALNSILELSFPHTLLSLKPREPLELSLTLRQGNEILEQYPSHGSFRLSASFEEAGAASWSV